MTNCYHDCSTCTAEMRECAFNKIRDQYKAQSQFTYDYNIHAQPVAMLLGLTNRCNLNCCYCFVQQNPTDMTYAIADQAMTWLKNIYKNNHREQKMQVSFFGGEPLLKYREIIIPLVKKWEDKAAFTITTNGVLLNENVVDFFYKHNIQILLSFDGVPEVQNQQRSNSFDTVLNNIPYILLRHPETVMRATITKNAIPYIYDSTIMAEELGFKKVVFCPNAFEDWSNEDETELYNQFLKVGQHIYEGLRKKGIAIKVDPIIKFFNKIDLSAHNQLYFNNSVTRCGLGTTSCAITPTGQIIPCQEKLSHPTTILGDVYQGIDPAAHQAFLSEYFQNVNNLTCNRGCSERDKLLCLSDVCPSRLEDLNYTLSTSSCAFNRVASKIAARLNFLCGHSNYNVVRSYFEEGDLS